MDVMNYYYQDLSWMTLMRCKVCGGRLQMSTMYSDNCSCEMVKEKKTMSLEDECMLLADKVKKLELDLVKARTERENSRACARIDCESRIASEDKLKKTEQELKDFKQECVARTTLADFRMKERDEAVEKAKKLESDFLYERARANRLGAEVLEWRKNYDPCRDELTQCQRDLAATANLAEARLRESVELGKKVEGLEKQLSDANDYGQVRNEHAIRNFARAGKAWYELKEMATSRDIAREAAASTVVQREAAEKRARDLEGHAKGLQESIEALSQRNTNLVAETHRAADKRDGLEKRVRHLEGLLQEETTARGKAEELAVLAQHTGKRMWYDAFWDISNIPELKLTGSPNISDVKPAVERIIAERNKAYEFGDAMWLTREREDLIGKLDALHVSYRKLQSARDQSRDTQIENLQAELKEKSARLEIAEASCLKWEGGDICGENIFHRLVNEIRTIPALGIGVGDPFVRVKSAIEGLVCQRDNALRNVKELTAERDELIVSIEGGNGLKASNAAGWALAQERLKALDEKNKEFVNGLEHLASKYRRYIPDC